MSASLPVSDRVARWLLRAAMGFYFARIERFHRERVPATGPLLFTSNHPNSVTDAFVIGGSVPRKVSFIATVRLFRIAPLRRLLRLHRELMAEIEAARWQVPANALVMNPKDSI